MFGYQYQKVYKKPCNLMEVNSQLTFICSKSTAETLEKGVKNVES